MSVVTSVVKFWFFHDASIKSEAVDREIIPEIGKDLQLEEKEVV